MSEILRIICDDSDKDKDFLNNGEELCLFKIKALVLSELEKYIAKTGPLSNVLKFYVPNLYIGRMPTFDI